MRKKKILATAWHPGGANAIVPVIKRLIAENKTDIVIIGHEYSEPIFEKAGIAFKKPPNGDISVKAMKKVLLEESPNLVLLGTGSQEGKQIDIIEQTTTAAANELGIKSLAVLDYWANYLQRFSDERTGVSLDRLTSKIAVMDEFAKIDMSILGFPKERLVITGNPHFDDLVKKAKNFSEEQRQEVKKKIGFSDNVLFYLACNVFSCWKETNGYWDMDVVQLVNKTVLSLPNTALAIRFHPRMPEADRVQVENTVLQSQSDRIRIVKDVDSQILMMTADLTVVEDSTVGIEAVLMNRPCISLQPGLKIKDSLIVSKWGIVPAAYEAERCENLLIEAADSLYRKEIIANYKNFVADGKATECVVRLVYLMLTIEGD
ncbi:MAG: hypothetical protein HYT36_03180 [Candidatus Staskawiczbacteria bacterium]|nr:hypothetical protein [Candidatus Staskawiczbacteria bacterium]